MPLKRTVADRPECPLARGHSVVMVFPLPDSVVELRMAQEGPRARCALQEIADCLRRRLKYEEHPAQVVDALEAVRSEFWEILKNNGLDLDW